MTAEDVALDDDGLPIIVIDSDEEEEKEKHQMELLAKKGHKRTSSMGLSILPTFNGSEEENLRDFALWQQRVESRGLHPEHLFSQHHDVHGSSHTQAGHSGSTFCEKLLQAGHANTRSVKVVEQLGKAELYLHASSS